MVFRHMDSDQFRKLERTLCAAIVLLKSYVLYATWGKVQGFDAGAWLEMFRVTRWFAPLPAPRALLASYHPPLSYLLARLIYVVIPNEIEASQVLSSLALLAAFFGLRSALRQIGCLESLAGLWLLYGGFSLPLYVWLAIETCYDGLVLAWFMLALALSVSLFWRQTPGEFWKKPRVVAQLLMLVLTLVAGLYTKFNGLLAFALPFTIIVVRRGLKAFLREVYLPAAVTLLALASVVPFYYSRYYATEHQWMPAAMEWQKSGELTIARAKRDAAPLEFLARMLRLPAESIAEAKRPVMDSFVHSIWFHTWKRDKWLGEQPALSLALSNFYERFFAYLALTGSLIFFVRPSLSPKQWRQLGWLLLCVTFMFSVAALAFAWKYPIWGWRVFKAKYMAAGALWVAYAAWMPIGMLRSMIGRPGAGRMFEWGVCFALFAFIIANHALPVY